MKIKQNLENRFTILINNNTSFYINDLNLIQYRQSFLHPMNILSLETAGDENVSFGN